MAKILSVIAIAFAFAIQTLAQASDVFAVQGNEIIAYGKYFSKYSDPVPSLPSNVPVYTYSSETIQVATSAKPTYKISFIGTSASQTLETFDGFRIHNSDGALLLECWGYSPLRSFDMHRPDGNDLKRTYFAISCEDGSLLLFFGGITFDGDDLAPEMMIVAVKGNQAKLVFDGPALIYNYSLYPTFSISFVDDMDWVLNEYGNAQSPTAEPLSSRSKYKIRKEGNGLKFSSWKQSSRQ